MGFAEIRPNIYRLSILDKKVLPYSVVVYIVKGDKEALLIDCGYDSAVFREEIVSGLAQLGIEPKNTKLLLTHIHIDHCGNADYLYRLGMSVLIGRKEFALSAGKATRISWETAKLCGVEERNFKVFVKETANKAVASSGGRLPFKMLDTHIPHTALDEGTELVMGEYRFKVLGFAGHSPYHLCLLEQHKQLMFSGDVVVFGAIPVVLSTALDQGMLHSYLSSLQTLKNLPCQMFCPGHGEVLHRERGEDGLAMELIRADYEKIMDLFYEWLCEEGNVLNTVQIAARLYKCEALTYLTAKHDAKTVMLMKVLSCLEYLYETGRVTRTVCEDTAYYKAII